MRLQCKGTKVRARVSNANEVEKIDHRWKKTQNEDLNFKSIFIQRDYDDFVIHKSSQPFEQNELKQEKESSDVSGCSGLSAKEKLLMLVFLMDIHPETKKLASFKRLAKMNQLRFSSNGYIGWMN